LNLKQLLRPTTSIQRLVTRLIASFLLVLTFSCVLMYALTQRQLCRDAVREMTSYAQITATHLQLQLENALALQTELQLDTFLQNYTSNHFDTTIQEYREFAKRLSERAASNSIIDTIDVYVGKTGVLFTSDLGPTAHLDARTADYLARRLHQLKDVTCTRQYRKKLYYWLPRADDHITILMPVPQKFTGAQAAFAAVSIRSSVLEALLDTNWRGESVYLLDQYGGVLAGGGGEKMPELDDPAYLSGSWEVGALSWRVVYLCPKSAAVNGATSSLFALSMCLVVLTSIALVWIMAVQMLRRIDTRVAPLTNLMETVKHGDYRIMPVDREKDEFTYLYDSFLSMADCVDRQFNEIYRLKILEQEARLKLLQAQVNPHFIYNIFNNMNWMIQLGRYDRLEELTDAVSVFFKKSLNDGLETIRVEDEKEKLESYVRIQQIRFGERLGCRVQIDPALYPQRMLNHLLQPIVENAVVHGIEPRAHAGTVCVTGRMETNGDMVFEICDDGAGMAPQRLKALRQALADAETGVQTGEFFALRNVSARIALYYGADYGLTIDSQPGQGTRVRIRLPGKTGEGGDELVSDDDCGR
jgi:two-component system sensor histidine kinase YesM